MVKKVNNTGAASSSVNLEISNNRDLILRLDKMSSTLWNNCYK